MTATLKSHLIYLLVKFDIKEEKKELKNYMGFFYGSPSEMAEMALVLQKRLKKRKRILDEKMEEEN